MIKMLIGFAFVGLVFLEAQGSKPKEPERPQSTGIEALGWLAGEWRGKVGETDVVSWHSDPAGGTIVMASKELENGKLSLFDFGVVSEKDGKVAYVPYPHGKSSVAFALTGFDPSKQRAQFENREHDFPKSFVFERKGESELAIVLEGDEGGHPMKFEYTLKLAK